MKKKSQRYAEREFEKFNDKRLRNEAVEPTSDFDELAKTITPIKRSKALKKK